MSDTCRCLHSLASHDGWGAGPCAALGCYCASFTYPPCLCSHIEDHHFIGRRGMAVCRSAACGCAEFRPGGSK